MERHALILVVMFSALIDMNVWGQKFKCAQRIDPVTKDTIYASELTYIGFNHKDHFVGKMNLQAFVFMAKSEFYLGLVLDYPNFQSFDAGTIVYLYFSDGSEMQLTVPTKYLSSSKHGSERWRQPEQMWYSYLSLPISAEQVKVFETKAMVRVKYASSTYTVNHRSRKILGKMIRRVRKVDRA